VSGRVQGVGFRYSTAIEAKRLGLVGWVRNRADGTVEVEAEGTDAAITDFLAWLDKGPPGASVLRVEAENIEPSGGPGFAIE
jgi:acylphosphatase